MILTALVAIAITRLPMLNNPLTEIHTFRQT